MQNAHNNENENKFEPAKKTEKSWLNGMKCKTETRKSSNNKQTTQRTLLGKNNLNAFLYAANCSAANFIKAFFSFIASNEAFIISQANEN